MPTKEALYDEAIALQQEGKLEAAMAKLKALEKDEPDYSLVHAALAVFHGKLEQHDEAIAYARKVCELEPEDPFSFTALSTICQKADRRTEAEEAMAQAMQLQFSGQ